MRKGIFYVFILVLCCFLTIPFRVRAGVKGGDSKKLLEGLGVTAQESGLGSAGSQETSIAAIIGKIVRIILSFLGVIFLVLMIYGGLLWMTAGGNDEQIGKAKKIMVPAIIGLGLVLAMYAITYFVVTELAGKTGIQ